MIKMNIKIKANPKEAESLYRFYVTANNKVMKAHLTYDEAVKFKEQLKNKGK